MQLHCHAQHHNMVQEGGDEEIVGILVGVS